MEFEKFPKPPIREAIFTVSFKKEIHIDVLKAFSDLKSIREVYKIKKDSAVIQQQIRTKQQKGRPHQANFLIKNLQDGYILQPSDKPEKVIQAKREALSFHKIESYADWETLIDEFEDIVTDLVRASIQPIEVKEISVRYINHIKYDVKDSLNEYFNLLPMAVEGVPRNLNSFFLQLGTTQNELHAIITETIAKIKEEPLFIIDLKVSKMLGITLDDESIWSSFDDIRKFKNQLFFSIITDKTKNLFR
jgi:uncharacterized protein (TIGR04255 family)